MYNEYKSRFDEKGFFAVEGAVPAKILNWANSRVDQFIACQLHEEVIANGVAVSGSSADRKVTGISDTHQNLGLVSMVLMGLPIVKEIADAVCGVDHICTHDWMVVKNSGNDQSVGWHQDFVHDGVCSVINIGIHLDDAIEDAVRFLPGDRSGAEDISAWGKQFNMNSPEAVSAQVSAGGITVHDVLLVHGSPKLEKQKQRKTFYLEFRPLAMLQGHPTITAEYISLRRKLFALAGEYYQRFNNSAFDTTDSLEIEQLPELLERLLQYRGVIEPANYGSHGGY